VTFRINGTTVFTGPTNANGVANYVYKACVPTGATIGASFENETNYAGSSSTGALTLSDPTYVWTGTNVNRNATTTTFKAVA
jgi:hypothetical protein